jgi:hypothetical protein
MAVEYVVTLAGTTVLHAVTTAPTLFVTFVTVNSVVAVRLTVVPGFDTCAQSIAAEPEEFTASVFPAVVGMSAERFMSEKSQIG